MTKPKIPDTDYRPIQRPARRTSQAPTDRATELANAEEVKRRFGDKIRFNHNRGTWFYFTGTHWAEDDNGHVDRLASEVAKTTANRLRDVVDESEAKRFQTRAESARGIASVVDIVKTLEGMTIGANQFDANQFKLSVANGTIDLKTGHLLPHNPDDLITHCLPTRYDPAALCPLWDSVIDRSMAGNPDLIAYLCRVIGLALTGDNTVQELFVLHGTGANGKSVIVDTVLWLLGKNAGIAPESLLMSRNGSSEHPTEIADLLGKRLVVASETESGGKLKTSTMKRITGDSTIKGRFMRQDFFEFPRTHKLWLVTNNRPRLSENSEAIWRRIKLIPFSVVIPESERDPNLIEKLKLEMSGILAWAVRGCLDWQANGMNPPKEVMHATDEYRAEADELSEFIEACCIVGDVETFRASGQELLTRYIDFARKTGERNPLDNKSFADEMRRRPGIIKTSYRVGEKVVRGYKGIAISLQTE